MVVTTILDMSPASDPQDVATIEDIAQAAVGRATGPFQAMSLQATAIIVATVVIRTPRGSTFGAKEYS